MMKRLIASATALSLFALPASPVLAHGGHGLQVQMDAVSVGGELELMQSELVLSVAADMLAERGYDVGPRDELAAEAITRSFGPGALDDAIAVSLPLAKGVWGTALIPVDSSALADGIVPLVVTSDDGQHRAYVLDFDDDHLSILRPDGALLVDAPLYEEGGALRLDGPGMTIFAIDLPLDFSLDGLINALQGVLDLLYTVKGLINSIICAVQGAVDLLYGLENCGIGTTTIGGGAIVGRIQCSAPKVSHFISLLQNSCF